MIFVVATVALAAHGRLNAGFGQPLRIANADALRPSVGVTNQAAVALRLLRETTRLYQRQKCHQNVAEETTRKKHLHPKAVSA